MPFFFFLFFFLLFFVGLELSPLESEEVDDADDDAPPERRLLRSLKAIRLSSIGRVNAGGPEESSSAMVMIILLLWNRLLLVAPEQSDLDQHWISCPSTQSQRGTSFGAKVVIFGGR